MPQNAAEAASPKTLLGGEASASHKSQNFLACHKMRLKPHLRNLTILRQNIFSIGGEVLTSHKSQNFLACRANAAEAASPKTLIGGEASASHKKPKLFYMPRKCG